MSKSPILSFISSSFPLVPGEEEHTNPGIGGRALADWLAKALGSTDVSVGNVKPKDFGWCIPVHLARQLTYVVCASSGEAQNEWLVFVFAEGGFLFRAHDRNTRVKAVATIFGKVRQLLEKHPGIRQLREE